MECSLFYYLFLNYAQKFYQKNLHGNKICNTFALAKKRKVP